jgi:hypothetical protein
MRRGIVGKDVCGIGGVTVFVNSEGCYESGEHCGCCTQDGKRRCLPVMAGEPDADRRAHEEKGPNGASRVAVNEASDQEGYPDCGAEGDVGCVAGAGGA